MSSTPLVLGVLRDAGREVSARPVIFLTLVVIAMTPGLMGLLLLDAADQRIAVLVSSLLNLYLQLFATVRTLGALGVMPAGYDPASKTEGRFPTAFWASFLSTLAIAAGLALLVVPGLLLLALWAVWMPAMAAERLSAVQALRRSWRLTRSQLATMLPLVLISVLAYAAVIATPLLLWWALGDKGLRLGEILIEPMLALVVIGSAVLWAVAYGALVAAERHAGDRARIV